MRRWRSARPAGIEVLAGQRVPRDRVDGEVPPPRRLLEGHRRVALDHERFVPAAALRFAAGQCHVDRPSLKTGKAWPTGSTRPNAREDRRTDPAAGRTPPGPGPSKAAEQLVADEPAHRKRAPAMAPDACGDRCELRHRSSMRVIGNDARLAVRVRSDYTGPSAPSAIG